MNDPRKEELENESAIEQDGTPAEESEAVPQTDGDGNEIPENGAEPAEATEAAEDAESEAEPSAEERLALERDDFKDRWMRAVAETDNVRKRSRREVQDARRFAQAETLRAFLEVYDNFERALQSMSVEDEDEQGKSVREGVELIFQKFQSALRERGAERIDIDGCEFDPSIHEAVGSMPREGVEPGHVIEVAQQGFKFQDMVLRPARVIVSS